jgi:hypothetical protein
VLTPTDLAATDAAVLDDLRALLLSYARDAAPTEVAVVGNAPLTESAARADRVDAAGLVVRCNAFVLDSPGGGRFVGRRADVVVLNAATPTTRSVFDRYGERLYLRVQAGAVYRRRPTTPMPRVDLWPDDSGAYSLPNRALVAELRDQLARHAPGDEPPDVIVPTSGVAAAWLAHRLLPEVRLLLTGFSALEDDAQPTQWRHHGREDAAPVPVAAAHVIGSEAALMRSWLAQGRAEHLP